MTKSKAAVEREASERADARAGMLLWVKPGDTVWTVMRHRSSSGMSRSISLVVVYDQDGTPRASDVSWRAAKAMGDKVSDRHGGIMIGGCGMDMGFALVYGLARTLWPDGFACTGQRDRPNRCPSNDHMNPGPDRDRYGTAVVHADGGYALRHEWL